MSSTESTSPAPFVPLARVADPGAARALLQHPLRARILALGAEACSPTAMSRQLGEPRQKVHYHVLALAKAGFLEAAETARCGNMTEQRWRATARAWSLAPELIGELGAHALPLDPADSISVHALLGRTARLQHEVGRAADEAAAQDKRLATLSLASELRFESATQRSAFTEALRDAITELVAKHASPVERDDGSPAPGRPYRLVLGCHPVPPGCLDAERARSTDTDTNDPDTSDSPLPLPPRTPKP